MGGSYPSTGRENSHREARVTCPTPVYLLHRTEKRLMVLPCKRRSCPVCGPGRWKPYQQAKYMSGVDDVPIEQLKVLTLTAPGADELPDWRAIDAWNQGATDRWEKFIRLLSKEYPGAEIEYWRVWEYQRRGALHVHAILRGLRWIHLQALHRIAKQAGWGDRLRVENVRKECGGHRGLLGYMTKYLLKGIDTWRVSRHMITCSRAWPRGWTRPGPRVPLDEWMWVSPQAVTGWLNGWVLLEGRPGARVDIMGPPGEIT
jgi:hypothetical protein